MFSLITASVFHLKDKLVVQILQEEYCYRSRLSGASHAIYSLVPACFFCASLNYSSCDLESCLLLYYQFEITNTLFYFQKTIFHESWDEDFKITQPLYANNN